MKLAYCPCFDSLYIDLFEELGTESEGVSGGIVIDHNATAHPARLEIENADQNVGLRELARSKLPTELLTIVA